MKSILDTLYDGQIYPSANINLSNTEYPEIMREINKKELSWKERMTEEEYRQFEELGNMYSAAYRIELLETFRYGFSLAVSLLTEAYGHQDKLARD